MTSSTLIVPNVATLESDFIAISSGGSLAVTNNIYTLRLSNSMTLAAGDGNLVFNALSGSVLTLSGGTISPFNTLDMHSHTLESNSGTLLLSNITLNNATVLLDSGTLEMGSGSVLSASDTINIGAQRFDFLAGAVTIGSLIGTGLAYGSTDNITIDVAGGVTDTFAGALFTSGTLFAQGAGTLALTGSNTLGGIEIDSGMVSLGGSVHGGTNLVVNAGTFALTGASATFNDLLGTGGQVQLNSNTLTVGTANSSSYAGAVSGAGGVVKQGTGTLTLTGASSLATLVINAGGVAFGAGGALSSTSAVAVNTGGTLSLSGGNVTLGDLSGTAGVVLLNSNTLTEGTAASTSFAGTLSGTGGLVKNGAGTLTLTLATSLGGATTLNAGKLALGSTFATSALTVGASATIALGGATTGGDLSGPGAVVLGANTLTVGTAGNSSFSGAISGTGGLVKQGAGTLTLSAGQSFSGGTSIQAGTIAVSGAGSLAATGAVTLAAGGGLSLSGNKTIGDLSGVGGQLVLSSSTLTEGAGGQTSFAGTISGSTGALVVAGGGKLLLAAANTYGQGTTISGATLELGSGATAGAGAIGFAAATGKLIIDGTTMPANTITGFAGTDLIDLAGLAPAVGYASLGSTDILSITTTAGTKTLQLGGSYPASAAFITAPDGAGGTMIQLATSFTVHNQAELNSALSTIDAGGAGNYLIQFAAASGTLALNSDLLALNIAAGKTLTIDGAGETLDGGGVTRGFMAYSGAATIENLTIQNALAVGGAGGNGLFGGGGGAGLGGGIFVASAATLTLSAVNFLADSAVGGAGGVDIKGKFGGGGGGMGGAGGSTDGTKYGGGGGIGIAATGGSASAGPGTGIVTGAPGGGTGTGSSTGGTGGGGGGAGVPPSGVLAGYAQTGGGGGGGVAGHNPALIIGGASNSYHGGSGGFGGGGGSGFFGGYGGFGGGGAGGAFGGGYGGFGGGGGGVDKGGSFGTGGFGGGNGGSGDLALGNYGGGGGLGAGADIFVQQGGSLVIQAGSLAAGSVAGGSGNSAGSAGSAFGTGIFIQNSAGIAQAITLSPAIGQTLTLGGVITDQHASISSSSGQGSLVTAGGGTAVITAADNFTGGITLLGGTLQLGAGGSLSGSGTLAINGGSFDLSGHSETFTNLSGTGGALLLGAGTLTEGTALSTSLGAALSGAGTLSKIGSGTLSLSGTGTLTGTIALGGGGLELANAAAAGTGTIAMTTTTSLRIDSLAAATAHVAGFALGNLIDFAAVPYVSGSSAIAAGGTITVTAGATTETLLVAGVDGQALAVSSDGHGGSNVVLIQTAFTVHNATELNTAIQAIDLNGTQSAVNTAYTITFASAALSIGLTGDLTAINLAAGDSVTINGLGGTLDGGGLTRGIFAYAGAVTIDNLAINHAKAVGGGGVAGYGGSGGGAGLGGGLFIAAAASVTLAGVSFGNDSAIGGAGGGGNYGGNSGGGGLGGAGGNAGGGSAGGGGGVGSAANGASTNTAAGNGIIQGAANGEGGTGLASGAGGFGTGGSGGTGNNTNGANGGFGGGGGSEGSRSSHAGGNGGFGGGGGGFYRAGGGKGGFGAGNAGNGGGGAGSAQGGGGGLGAGGDVFVQQGGTLVIQAGSLAAGTVTGGGASSGGGTGHGFGDGIFLQGSQTITLAPLTGQILTIAGGVTDQTGADTANAYNTPGAGALAISGAGLVVLKPAAANGYTGGTVIGGTATLDIGTTGAAGSGSITFAVGAHAMLRVDSGIALANTIKSFTSIDVIDLPGIIALTATTTLAAGNILTVNDGSGHTATLHLDPTQNFSGAHFTPYNDGAGGTAVACYCAGTRIATPGGEVPIEDLRIGDLVETHSGEAVPVKWIGQRSYGAGAVAANRQLRPVRIAAHALAAGVPARELLVSSEHALLVDGALIPAASLVNGRSVTRVDARHVHYLHLELERHDLITAEGCPAESFVDHASRCRFQNAAEYDALYPGAVQMPASMALPRLHAGPIVDAAWRRIAMRAGLAELPTDVGELRGHVERIGKGIVEGWAMDDGAPVRLELLIDAAPPVALIANGYRGDLDRAGLNDGRCCFRAAVPAGAALVRVRRAIDGAEMPLAA